MRPIDADALKEELNNWAVDLTKSKFPHYIKDDADCIIDNAPTIAALPVRHGMWEKNDDYTCSLCGYRMVIGDGAYNYCPNCGARMDGESDEID